MGKLPHRMYHQIKGHAYTRREYMGGVPATRISQFTVGNPGDYPITLTLSVTESCQIRDKSLEAARIAATRLLQAKTTGGFYMRIKTFPHIVLRQHKQVTGAGADRISGGMRAAFGKAIGTAARVSPGQCIISIETTKENFPVAKQALKKASRKLPTPCRIIIEKGSELVS